MLLPPGQGGGREGGARQEPVFPDWRRGRQNPNVPRGEPGASSAGIQRPLKLKQIPACAGMTRVAGMTRRKKTEAVSRSSRFAAAATPTPALPLQGGREK